MYRGVTISVTHGSRPSQEVSTSTGARHAIILDRHVLAYQGAHRGIMFPTNVHVP